MTDASNQLASREKASPSRPRVLVVDDHEELAENVVEILSGAGSTSDVQCVAVRNAEQALLEAEKQNFELALIDLHLPDAHGLELAETLKLHCPHVQIVVLTGDATVESAIGALDKGVFAYVLKPFRAQQLVETASRAIDRSRLLAEREQLRAELERSERRNREVIDGVPAFVTALDESGRIVVWNSQLENVTGFTRQEMLGATGRDIVGHDGTLRLRLKGGGHRSVRWKLAAVPARSGSPNITYGLGVDVTEESEMQRRTLRAERLAAVGTLAAGLAHEVRNPLNSATLQLQMLERKVLKGNIEADAIRGTVQIVRGEIERLEHLVKDFLAFAKPQVFEPQPGDLNRVVEAVLTLVAVEANRAEVHVRRQLDPNLGLVPLEEQSIKQLVLNLTRNAIEALQPRGGGTLTIVTRPVQDAAAVALDVIDDGPGFDESMPIFDAFYTTKEGGTGLGLSIAHRIVTEHGGTIGVVSRQGHTCFTIQLPQPAAAGPGPTPPT